MKQAASLRELLLIRSINRGRIESVNGMLGSALGIKHSTDRSDPAHGKPAIIVFVPRKINERWLSPDQVLPKLLTGPEDLVCPVEVVEGGKLNDITLQSFDTFTEQEGLVSWLSLRETPDLSSQNIKLRTNLRGWSETIGPGSQLGGVDRYERGFVGTLGCIAKERSTGELGFITNQHVAQNVGASLFHPDPGMTEVAVTKKAYKFVDDEKRFPGIVDEPHARYRVDCAFAKFTDAITTKDIDPRVPVLSKNSGRVGCRRLGDPYRLDIDTMGPLGMRVFGVGRTRSFQRGTIAAFAYEHVDAQDDARYTDYLIIGDEPDEFSDPGDSGKLIFLEGVHPRPVALLWGGWYEKLRSGKDQENWTYAIDINFVLELLGVDIVKEPV